MAQVIPRWEWRTFGRTIKTRIDVAACPHTRHLESSEIYLASANAEGNAKIRNEQLEIKILEQVNDDGLEQWVPVLKAAFPLSVNQLAAIYRALNIAPPLFGPRRPVQDHRTRRKNLDRSYRQGS